MGLIKGVGQGKGERPPAKPTHLYYQSWARAIPIHNVITMACWSGGSQGQSTGQSQGKGDTHERVKRPL